MKTPLSTINQYTALLVAFSVGCILSSPLYADPIFKMAFGQNPDIEAQYQFYKQIYTRAFKELGYTFEYKVCPSKRCSLDANRGYVDGEPQRIFKYNETYTNMIRVEEAIFVNRSIAVVTNPAIQINGLESLKDSGLRVDYIRGSIWSKKHLEPLIQPQHLTEISMVEQAIKRLEVGHTDVLIGLESTVLPILKTDEFKNTPVIVAGIVGENFSYPFVYKSHKDIADKLAQVLRRMKTDGLYSQILNQTMPFMSLQHVYHLEKGQEGKLPQ